MKKKKPDMLTILLYAIIIFAVLYVSAGLGAAMDLSVDDDGVLDFNVLMTQFETVLTSTDTVGAHFTDFSSYSFKITLMVGFALGIYALMKTARLAGRMKRKKNFLPTGCRQGASQSAARTPRNKACGRRQSPKRKRGRTHRNPHLKQTTISCSRRKSECR